MGSTAAATRGSNCCCSIRVTRRPSARKLTDNPAVIHDFGAWSPDATRIAYAANERDEAHFDVYVQDIASGARQCVYQGHNMVSVSGFRSDGAKLALLHDRGFGDMSLLLLDVASGDVQTVGSPSNFQSVRWSSDGRTLLALTDHGGSEFLRLCRLDPDSGDISVVSEAAGRDVEGWSISSDARLLATIENDRGYGVLRVGPIDGDRPVVTGLPRGVVGDLSWSADGSALAFSAAAPTDPAIALGVARRRSARRMAAGTATRSCRLRRSGTGVVAQLRRHSRSRMVRVATQSPPTRRLSSHHVGAWRAGQPDAAEFPA